jgi:hypothetical protein
LLDALVQVGDLTYVETVGRETIALSLADRLTAYSLARVHVVTMVAGHIDQAISCVIQGLAFFQKFGNRTISAYIDRFTLRPVACKRFKRKQIRVIGCKRYVSNTGPAPADVFLQGDDFF